MALEELVASALSVSRAQGILSAGKMGFLIMNDIKSVIFIRSNNQQQFIIPLLFTITTFLVVYFYKN